MSASEYPRERLNALFAAIDDKDADGFVSHLTEDASFRFGSAPAAVGRDAIRDGVSAFFESIAGLSHRVDRIVAQGATLITEGLVTYDRHDGRSVEIPFVDVFEVDGQLIDDYRIYIDIGPLYAE